MPGNACTYVGGTCGKAWESFALGSHLAVLWQLGACLEGDWLTIFSACCVSGPAVSRFV